MVSFLKTPTLHGVDEVCLGPKRLSHSEGSTSGFSEDVPAKT